MSSLRDWARLDARWYEDPVLRAAAKQAPAAFVMWPVLVGMAKAASHVDDNPQGVVRVSIDDLAAACCVTSRRAMAALEALTEGEFVAVEAYRVGLLSVRLKSFAKWQTPRKSKAEHAANKRWRTSRGKGATSHHEVGEASPPRTHGVMPDVDVDVDDGAGKQPPAQAPSPLPPSPRSVAGQIRAAQRDLGSHVSQVIVAMIARRNGDAARLLTEREEFDDYWRKACELLDEFGPHRLRMAANKAGEANAVRMGFLATVCKADQRIAANASATDPDLAQSDWAGYTGTTATVPDPSEAA